VNQEFQYSINSFATGGDYSCHEALKLHPPWYVVVKLYYSAMKELNCGYLTIS